VPICGAGEPPGASGRFRCTSGAKGDLSGTPTARRDRCDGKAGSVVSPQENFKDHAANERTFLAWLRTAIAIVGVGLTAAKLTRADIPGWSDLAMVLSGGVVVILAFVRMRMLRALIDAEEAPDEKGTNWPDLLLFALVIALMVLLGIFILHVR